MPKFEFSLPTISGFVILAFIVFIALTLIVQQFIPTFKFVQMNIGGMVIILTLAGLTAITIIQKGFVFDKTMILPLIIMIVIVIGIIMLFPDLMKGTMFQQSAINLKSIFIP